MNSTKLNDWLEIIGIFAVVASLIFVGMELRQAQVIATAQAYQERAIAASEWSTALAANPVGVSAYLKIGPGQRREDELTDEERFVGERIHVALFQLYDNTHFQYVNGLLSEELWLMVRETLKGGMQRPFSRNVYISRARYARPSFRAVVEEVAREIDDE